jgi:glucose-6-phosphate 1-epimerase
MKQPATLQLRLPSGDSAEVSLWGGQVVSWKTADGCERLYLSPQARQALETGVLTQPLRGGIPVCYPQFAARGPLLKHGWVRQVMWQVQKPASQSADGHGIELCLYWEQEGATLQESQWPHSMILELKVTLRPNELNVQLQAINTGDDAFSFTGALHTYLLVDNVRSVSISGLENTLYENGLRPGHYEKDHDKVLTIHGELERFYPRAPNQIKVFNCKLKHRRDFESLDIIQQGFSDVVCWNPGPIKAESLSDMPVEDWKRMLCVEAAQIYVPITLKPDDRWCGTQTLKKLQH